MLDTLEDFYFIYLYIIWKSINIPIFILFYFILFYFNIYIYILLYIFFLWKRSDLFLSLFSFDNSCISISYIDSPYVFKYVVNKKKKMYG